MKRLQDKQWSRGEFPPQGTQKLDVPSDQTAETNWGEGEWPLMRESGRATLQKYSKLYHKILLFIICRWKTSYCNPCGKPEVRWK